MERSLINQKLIRGVLNVHYSGFLVLHRQEWLDNGDFYNVSAYRNRDFSCYTRRTILQNVECMDELIKEEDY